jgi:hypothetical protein
MSTFRPQRMVTRKEILSTIKRKDRSSRSPDNDSINSKSFWKQCAFVASEFPKRFPRNCVAAAWVPLILVISQEEVVHSFIVTINSPHQFIISGRVIIKSGAARDKSQWVSSTRANSRCTKHGSAHTIYNFNICLVHSKQRIWMQKHIRDLLRKVPKRFPRLTEIELEFTASELANVNFLQVRRIDGVSERAHKNPISRKTRRIFYRSPSPIHYVLCKRFVDLFEQKMWQKPNPLWPCVRFLI